VGTVCIQYAYTMYAYTRVIIYVNIYLCMYLRFPLIIDLVFYYLRFYSLSTPLCVDGGHQPLRRGLRPPYPHLKGMVNGHPLVVVPRPVPFAPGPLPPHRMSGNEGEGSPVSPTSPPSPSPTEGQVRRPSGVRGGGVPPWKRGCPGSQQAPWEGSEGPADGSTD